MFLFETLQYHPLMIGLTWDVYVCGDAAGAGGMGRREEGRVKAFWV